MIELLSFIPKSVQIVIASAALGGGAFYAHETRYVTSSQFTKNYLLSLKQEIREIKKILKDDSLTAREREGLNDDLAALIDELCLETQNNDRLCRSAS